MAYASLGARRVTAAPDATGNNPGQLTSVFDQAVLGIFVPVFELFRAVAKQVPSGASADIYIDEYEISFNNFVGGSEWDPAQPALLQTTQSIYFYWSIPATDPPLTPVVTCWFRYDASMWSQP